MSMDGSLICLYQEHTTNLVETIKTITKFNYDMIITPIVNPLFYRNFLNETQHINYTRSDLILSYNDWVRQVIPKIDNSVDCDSKDDHIRWHSESTLHQEMAFANHLSDTGYSLIRLNYRESFANLARIISTCKNSGSVLIEIPMTNPKTISKFYRKAIGQSEDLKSNVSSSTIDADDTWHWWNQFRFIAKFNKRFRVALEITNELPTERQLMRWLGEPVAMILIPCEMFATRRIQGVEQLFLTEPVKKVLKFFIERLNINLAVKANLEDRNISEYAEVLRHLSKCGGQIDAASERFEDQLLLLQNPINLSYKSKTNDDAFYQHAIEQVLYKKVRRNGEIDNTVVVFLIDDMYGQLIQTIVNATQNTNIKTKVFVFEENRANYLSLETLVKESWPSRDITVIYSMDKFNSKFKADILITNLRETNVYAAKQMEININHIKMHLKTDISIIPSQKKLYIRPIMSYKLASKLNNTDPICDTPNKSVLADLDDDSECIFQAFLRSYYFLDKPMECFTFDYVERLKNNEQTERNNFSEMSKLQFTIEQDCVLSGFIGYFDTVLYEDITISGAQEFDDNERHIAKWFPCYFPLNAVQKLKQQDVLETNFWLYTNYSKNRLWFEWCTSQPNFSHIHNENGNACSKEIY